MIIGDNNCNRLFRHLSYVLTNGIEPLFNLPSSIASLHEAGSSLKQYRVAPYIYRCCDTKNIFSLFLQSTNDLGGSTECNIKIDLFLYCFLLLANNSSKPCIYDHSSLFPLALTARLKVYLNRTIPPFGGTRARE